jgi:hypothetical protein
MDKPPIVFSPDIYQLFMEAIEVYEDCLIDAFKHYELPIKFLDRNVKFSVNEYPWTYTYVYDSAISMDVDIFPSGHLELVFTAITGRFVDGNVIHLNAIQDSHLAKVDLMKLSSGYVIRDDIGNNESKLAFRLSHELDDKYINALAEYHKFADVLCPGMRDLFLYHEELI